MVRGVEAVKTRRVTVAPDRRHGQSAGSSLPGGGGLGGRLPGARVLRGFGGGGGGAAAKARARESKSSSHDSCFSVGWRKRGMPSRNRHSRLFKLMPDRRISAQVSATRAVTTGFPSISIQVSPASRTTLSASRAAFSASPSWAEPIIPSSLASRSAVSDGSVIASLPWSEDYHFLQSQTRRSRWSLQDSRNKLETETSSSTSGQ